MTNAAGVSILKSLKLRFFQEDDECVEREGRLSNSLDDELIVKYTIDTG